MVKFGKEYRQLQLDEWKKYYLDYKGLKHKIKLMKNELLRDKSLKDIGMRPSLLTTPLLPDEIEENKESSNIFKDKKGEDLKEFITLLINEFKKSYSFFINIEKVLIRKVNTHLYTQTSYSTFSLSELSKEMTSLSLTIYLTKCLNDFINDTMMAVKKILKKFDKNFSHIFGLITPHIILQLLSKEKSELEYFLQFKVIDEISIIAEASAAELKKYFDQNNDNSNSDNIQYRNTFLEKYNETLKYIKSIDELIYFKTQYKDWVDYVSKKKVKTSSKYLENDIFNPILSSSYYKDNLIDKFLSTKDAFKEIKNMQKKMSLVNKRNIILILTQVFFYNSLLTCVFPVFYFSEFIGGLKSNNANEDMQYEISFFIMNVFIFVALASTYLGQWLSIFFFYNYISLKKIKFSFILCYLFIFIGSLIYILTIGYEKKFYGIHALFLGGARLLIGLGTNPMIGKKYITLYTPKYYLPLLSKLYLVIELCGLILGPSIASLFSFLYIGSFFNILNCIGYYGVIGSFILFIINIILFVSPKDSNFSVLINQSREDVNASSSQYIQNNFDDNEDSEDKEFYRLQKERNERKKAGLEPTKSDDVNIEVNDNEPAKNVGINNTASATNFKEEKEDDETNYNKIMEKAGEGLGQNEIVDKYYKNVDTERYSDVNISNEQKETIDKIIKQLYACQEKSNFTYINMMPRTIDDITLNEQKTFGYMNKNFLIMLVLLFFNSLIKENLMIYSSFYILYVVYDDGKIITNAIPNDSEYVKANRGIIQIICLLISAELLLQLISILFIMPFYKVNLIFKKNLIIFMIASIVFMIPLLFLKEGTIFAYIPIVSIDILIHKIIEVICSCYLVYLIPPQWKYSNIRASSLPIYLMTFGKMLACAICLICYDNEKNIDKRSLIFRYNQIILTLIAVISYGLFGLIIYKSTNFRVKALARVLRQKAVE